MTLVVLVLKMIGILLLCLLGLLVFLLLLTLFFPVSYRIVGTYQEKIPRIQIRLRWLFGLFSFRFRKEEQDQEARIRIMGFKKMLFPTDKEEAFANTKENIVTDDTVTDDTDDTDPHENMHEEQVPVENSKSVEAPLQAMDVTASIGEETSEKKHPFQSIRSIFQRIKEAFFNIKQTLQRIASVISDETNRFAAKSIFQKLFLFLKRILPKRFRLSAQFSTGAPDTTGQVLGILAMFPMGYRNRWSITPDFTADSFYINADFDVKGRLFFFQAVRLIFSVVLDKNCRSLFRRIMRKA